MEPDLRLAESVISLDILGGNALCGRQEVQHCAQHYRQQRARHQHLDQRETTVVAQDATERCPQPADELMPPWARGAPPPTTMGPMGPQAAALSRCENRPVRPARRSDVIENHR